MDLALFFDQLEVGTEQRTDAGTVVSLDRETAATFGAVRCEGRDHGISAAAHRARGELGVCLLSRGFGEKVQDGSIVPNVDARQCGIARDIGDHPFDIGGARREARLGVLEGDRGHIEDDGSDVSRVEQRVDEQRRPCADVDDASPRTAKTTNERERPLGARTVPADFRGLPCAIDLVPMGARFHANKVVPFGAACILKVPLTRVKPMRAGERAARVLTAEAAKE